MDHPGGHPGAGYGSRLPGYNGRSLDALNDYLGDLASYRYAASREATGVVPDDPDIRFDAVGVTVCSGTRPRRLPRSGIRTE